MNHEPHDLREPLRSLLDPADDGRAFTDAVLFEASGRLARRRAAAVPAQGSAWAWLERWARPWVVAATLAVAMLALVPVLRPSPANTASAVTEPAEVLLVTEQPEVALTVSFTQ